MKIPDYYRQFQNQPPAEKKSESKDAGQVITPEQKPASGTVVPQDKTVLYQANTFTLQQLEDWEDKTMYTLNGPVTDGIQHNVIINVEKECTFDNVFDYADWQIRTLEDELKGCTLLKRGEIKLNNGTDAYEAVFSWYPSDDLRIYQHQVFTIIEKTAYKMTASFTKKTWKTLGPSVLRMMLSLDTKK
jgi:hypothetical protein